MFKSLLVCVIARLCWKIGDKQSAGFFCSTAATGNGHFWKALWNLCYIVHVHVILMWVKRDLDFILFFFVSLYSVGFSNECGRLTHLTGYTAASLCLLSQLIAWDFRVCKSVNYHTIQVNQTTRCNNFSSLLRAFSLQLNMFRASSRPSSGAQQLQ